MDKALEGSLAAILIECRTGEITIEQGVKEIEQAFQYHRWVTSDKKPTPLIPKEDIRYLLKKK